jgi:hypothetical protein
MITETGRSNVGLTTETIIDRFREEAKQFRRLCQICGLGEVEEIEKLERTLARKLDELDFAALIRKGIESGLIVFRD